jgi:hypothetical protein
VKSLASIELAELLLSSAVSSTRSQSPNDTDWLYRYQLESSAGHNAITLTDTTEGIYRQENLDSRVLEGERRKLCRGRIELAVSL